jgi:hypothetical protein
VLAFDMEEELLIPEVFACAFTPPLCDKWSKKTGERQERRGAGDKEHQRETKTTNHERPSDASSPVSGVDTQVEEVRFQWRGPGGIRQQD